MSALDNNLALIEHLVQGDAASEPHDGQLGDEASAALQPEDQATRLGGVISDAVVAHELQHNEHLASGPDGRLVSKDAPVAASPVRREVIVAGRIGLLQSAERGDAQQADSAAGASEPLDGASTRQADEVNTTPDTPQAGPGSVSGSGRVPPGEGPADHTEEGEAFSDRYQRSIAITLALARRSPDDTRELSILPVPDPVDFDGFSVPLAVEGEAESELAQDEAEGVNKLTGELGVWEFNKYGARQSGVVYRTAKVFRSGETLSMDTRLSMRLGRGDDEPSFDVHNRKAADYGSPEPIKFGGSIGTVKNPWPYATAVGDIDELTESKQLVRWFPDIYKDLPTLQERAVLGESGLEWMADEKDLFAPPPNEEAILLAVEKAVGILPVPQAIEQLTQEERDRYSRLESCVDDTSLWGVLGGWRSPEIPGEFTLPVNPQDPAEGQIVVWNREVPGQPIRYIGISQRVTVPGVQGKPTLNEITLSFMRDDSGIIVPLRFTQQTADNAQQTMSIEEALDMFESRWKAA